MANPAQRPASDACLPVDAWDAYYVDRVTKNESWSLERYGNTIGMDSYIIGVTRKGAQIRLEAVPHRDYTWLNRLIGFLFHVGRLAHFSARPSLIVRRLEALKNDPEIVKIASTNLQGSSLANIDSKVLGLRVLVTKCHNCALPALFTNMLKPE